MHFQHVLSLWELQQITDMSNVRNCWKILENIATDDFIFVLLYLVHRDTAVEEEFDIVIQMTLEPVLAETFRKKEVDEKSNF